MSIQAMCEELDGFLVVKAETEDGESATVFYEIAVGNDISLETVKAAVEKHFPHTRCSHDYDCCGCWFRFATFAIPEYQGYFIIKEHWARNV